MSVEAACGNAGWSNPKIISPETYKQKIKTVTVKL
jgi:hypothetical protein